MTHNCQTELLKPVGNQGETTPYVSEEEAGNIGNPSDWDIQRDIDPQAQRVNTKNEKRC
jgi:hypothetical protein